MPIVHDPAAGRFTSNGGASGVGTASKLAIPAGAAGSSGGGVGSKYAGKAYVEGKGKYAVTYPASTMTSLPAGAQSFKARGERPKEGDPVKVRDGDKVFKATTGTVGPSGLTSVWISGEKMGRPHKNLSQAMLDDIYPDE